MQDSGSMHETGPMHEDMGLPGPMHEGMEKQGNDHVRRKVQ